MQRKKAISIGESLQDFFVKNPVLQKGLDARKACELILKELGPLSKQIGEVNCPSRVLEVKVYSSGLRERLTSIRAELTEKINEQIGHPFLVDIRFYG